MYLSYEQTSSEFMKWKIFFIKFTGRSKTEVKTLRHVNIRSWVFFSLASKDTWLQVGNAWLKVHYQFNELYAQASWTTFYPREYSAKSMKLKNTTKIYNSFLY